MEDFWRIHWRRKPLFVKGGAVFLLEKSISYAAFDEIAKELRSTRPEALRERPGEVVFIEAISRYNASLAAAGTLVSQRLSLPDGWIDGVRTLADSGIGSHYDHSDNFVLQQQGTKIWRVAPPVSIPPREKACRMLGVGNFGAAEIVEEEAETYVLEPGDMLYLPLFWLHSGISRGPSLSLSLVCPAESMQTVLLRAMRFVMTRHLLGHQPSPSLPAGSGEAEEARWTATMARSASLLLNRLTEEDLLNELASAMRAALSPGSGKDPNSGS